jgi:hypothetical protein
MQKNQYTTPTLHLVKPQPGSQNFGSAMNENLNKIDEAFTKIVASYNSVVKKIEGSSGYIAADQDYYLYSYIKNENTIGQLYKIPMSTTLEELQIWNDEEHPDYSVNQDKFKSYLVEKLEDLTAGAYVLSVASSQGPHYTKQIKIDILGIEVWNDNDIILIQHVWRNSESRYETIGTKMPHLTGGYYKPDSVSYSEQNRAILQSFVKQSVVQAEDDVTLVQPYTTYAPYEEEVDIGRIWFKEIIHIPSFNERENKYVYTQYPTGKKIYFPFSPVNATSRIETITFTPSKITGIGYPTTIKKEDNTNTNGLSKRTCNNIQAQFFDVDGSLIFVNHSIIDYNNYYYITNNDNTFYLPKNATIKITVHSTTTESVSDANVITSTFIDGLFSTEA